MMITSAEACQFAREFFRIVERDSGGNWLRASEVLPAAMLEHNANEYVRYLRCNPDLIRMAVTQLLPSVLPEFPYIESWNTGDGRYSGAYYRVPPYQLVSNPSESSRGFEHWRDALKRSATSKSLSSERALEQQKILMKDCSDPRQRVRLKLSTAQRSNGGISFDEPREPGKENSLTAVARSPIGRLVLLRQAQKINGDGRDGIGRQFANAVSLRPVLVTRPDGAPSKRTWYLVADLSSNERTIRDQTTALLRAFEVAQKSLRSAQPILSQKLADPLSYPSDLDAALEDMALGGEGGRSVLRRSSARNILPLELLKAREKADLVGQQCEELIDAFLGQQKAAGILREVEWASELNAICPYDFRVIEVAGTVVKLDVKSTTGPFDRAVHISLAELKEAGAAPERYDLYRVYNLTVKGGNLRVAYDIGKFAREVLSRLKLPAGVACDSFSVQIRQAELNWGPETYLRRSAGSEPNDPADAS